MTKASKVSAEDSSGGGIYLSLDEQIPGPISCLLLQAGSLVSLLMGEQPGTFTITHQGEGLGGQNEGLTCARSCSKHFLFVCS